MSYLFSKNNLKILESLSFTKTLYAFDFDGTLCKIVPSPGDAVIPNSTSLLLQKLSQYAPVAIISGRGLKDLKSRLNYKYQYIIGNHGLEGLKNSKFSLKKAQQACNQWKKIINFNELKSGIEVEDKLYSLSIHYRRSRNKKAAKELILKKIAKLTPTPRFISGKLVANIVPLTAPHKGVALLELMKTSHAKHALYIGDDDTDEDVFSLPNQQIMNIRVGQKKDSNARYFLKRQTEINKLLKLLISFQQGNKV